MFLKLYEYEAKSLFSLYNLPTPKGTTTTSSQQAYDIAAQFCTPVAVKAQVLVAGRGKAGGILLAKTPQQAKEAAQNLLNSKIKGEAVTKVLVEEQVSVRRELYFGLTVDRFNRCYVAVASEAGGVDIEEVAEKRPEKIYKQLLDPQLGLRLFHARQIAKGLGYSGSQMLELAQLLQNMYRLSMDYDAQLVEVNPLVETTDGRFVAVDARLILDDNALFQHPQYLQLRMEHQRDLATQEYEAQQNGLEYVLLDGDIGVVGNGAGLVMATMDLIALYGGQPANFLDMGGGAPLQRIKAALEAVLSNPKVKVLFVNIVGGITHCDEVAKSILLVRQQLKTPKPLVVRLMGTNEAEGKRILTDAGVPVFDRMEKAASRAVKLAQMEVA
jgi:succinyl-CoA synthetase beta subunit